MKIHPFLLAVCIFLQSCNNSVNTDLPYRIDLENSVGNVTSVPLSTIGKRLEYIPLETDTSCLIKSITKAFLTDSLIFISDYEKLLKFDLNGRFIKQIGKNGRGPGEYSGLGNFIVDDENREIFVLSSRIVLVYDYEGNFKRDFKIDFVSRQFIMNGNDLIFHPFNFASFSAGDSVYSWYISDRTGTIHQKLENTLKRKNKGFIVPMSPLYLYDGTPHLMEFGVDTLYNFVDSEKKPYAIFYPGKMKFPPDPAMDEVRQIDGKIWISDIRETGNLFFVNLWWDTSDSISNCIYDKSSSSFSILKNDGFVNDIDGGLTFWPRTIINDDIMVDYADAFKMITASKKAGPGKGDGEFFNVVNKLSETSNPVIIILRK